MGIMGISLRKLALIVNQKRKERGFTQEALGEQTGINKDLVSRLERGVFFPSIVQLNELMRVLHFQTTDITEEEEESKVFVAMMGSARTEAERAGFDQMISMMLCLRKHDRLKKRNDEGVLC